MGVCVQVASRKRLGYLGGNLEAPRDTLGEKEVLFLGGRGRTLAEKMGWSQCPPHFYSWVNTLSESKPAGSSHLASA